MSLISYRLHKCKVHTSTYANYCTACNEDEILPLTLMIIGDVAILKTMKASKKTLKTSKNLKHYCCFAGMKLEINLVQYNVLLKVKC